MPASSNLIKALMVTIELLGQTVSEAAAAVMAEDLSLYPEAQVLASLVRCRRELKGRLTIAEVISRLDDGRPGPEEAWAMMPRDEEATVVWTDEMAAAWGIAAPLIRDGDEVAGRMAFKEAYARLVTDARSARAPAKWRASLGHDSSGREHALGEAVRLGRLGADHAKALLPYHQVSPQFLALMDKLGRPLRLVEGDKEAA